MIKTQCKLPYPSSYGIVHVGRHDYRMGLWLDGSQLFDVVKQVRHPQFNDALCCGYDEGVRFTGVSHDFLLLKLDGQSSKQVVSLDTNKDSMSDGEELHVIGFGDTTLAPYQYDQPDRLHEVTVNYMNNQQCARSSIYPNSLLPEANFCAMDAGEDGCQGDSGGPLLMKGNINDKRDDVQVGVVSWGLGCAEHPGVYARVSEGYDWIEKQVCKISRNPPASFNCNTDVENEKDTPSFLDNAIDGNIKSSSDFFGTFGTINSTHTTAMTQTTPTKPILPQDPQLAEIMDGNSQPLSVPESSSSSSSSSVPVPAPTLTSTSTSTSDPIPGTIYESLQESQLNSNNDVWPSNDNFSRPNRKKYFAPSTDRDRTSLPSGSSCRNITDPQVCCAASDSTFVYKDQICVPAKSGHIFSSGSSCESIGWLEDNYDTSRSTELFEKDFCDTMPSNRRFKLPISRPCSAMFSSQACCMARDVDGYPCVPAKKFTTFTEGTKCEPTTYIARHQPENAGTCIVAFS